MQCHSGQVLTRSFYETESVLVLKVTGQDLTPSACDPISVQDKT